jgi:MoaA/NifB/PqqE/SkfB family radical SAM enzyme
MKPRSLARLLRAFGPAWLRRPPTPRRAVVALTRRCNCRCSQCSSWAMESGEELSPAELGELFAAMPRLAWLDLTGGEPCLRADLLECTQAVLDNSPSLAVLHFPTNGWYPERAAAAARLVRARRPEVEVLVTVSLDGPPALHDRMRGREGSWAKAVETWRLLREIPGVDVFVGTTVGPDNRAALDDLGSALHRELPGFEDRHWHWNLFQVSALFFGNAPLADADRAADLRLVARHLRRRWPPRSPVDLMELGFLVNLRAWLAGEPLGLACQALHSACFVSAEGVLYPCHVWDRPIADLRARGWDLRGVWSEAATLEARRGAVALDCGGCFTPCEAYPTLVGSPGRAVGLTLRRGVGAALAASREVAATRRRR